MDRQTMPAEKNNIQIVIQQIGDTAWIWSIIETTPKGAYWRDIASSMNGDGEFLVFASAMSAFDDANGRGWVGAVIEARYHE